MKLNHLDLQVSDVEAARAFFETNFGLRFTYGRPGEIAFLSDDLGLQLGVSNLKHGADIPIYPPDFHIGFILEDSAQVEALYARFQQAGVGLLTDVRQGGPNLYFICAGPDGIAVEVRGPQPKTSGRD